MKYALIGCGRIAINHILAAMDNKLEIVAVCDIVESKMQLLLERYHLENNNIKRYTSYQKLVDDNRDIELISIATESGVHAEIAKYCIKNKINVIIEKPMAMNISDANEIIQMSDELNVKVSACHQNRFNLAVQEMRRALENGRFGKISHGSINVRWNRDKNYYDQANWRGTWKSDGGALMNQCIHGIDLLRWMMGDEIDEVYGQTRQQFHHYLEAEDVGMAVVKFKNGAIGTIEGTTNVYHKNLEETLYLFGETGTCKLGGKSCNAIEVWEFKSDDSRDEEFRQLYEQTTNVYGNGHGRLFANVIDCINNDKQPLVDARAGKRALELVLAIYKSQKEGRPVKLPLVNFSSLDMMDFFSEGVSNNDN